MKKQTLVKALLPMFLLGTPAHASSRSFSKRNKDKFKAISVQSSVDARPIKRKSLPQEASSYDVNPFDVFGTNTLQVKKNVKVQEDVLAFLEQEGLLSSSTISPSLLSGDLQSQQNRKEFAHASALNHCHASWGVTYNTGSYSSLNATNCATSYSGTWHSAAAYATLTAYTVKNKTATGVSVDVTFSQASTVHAVLVESTKTAPSTAQVQAGTDGDNSAAANYQTASVSNSGTLTFTGMSSSKTYTIYIVGINGSNDQPATPDSLNATFETGQIIDSNSWIYPKVKTSTGSSFTIGYWNNASSAQVFSTYNGSALSQITSFTNTTVGSASLSSNNQDFAVDSSGNIYVAISSYSEGLFYGYYNGTSWSFQKINSVSGINNVAISLDSSNKAHISFSNTNVSSSYNVRYMTNKAGSWVSTTLATTSWSTPSQDIAYTNVIPLSNGTVNVIWGYDEGTQGGNFLNSSEFYMANSSNFSGISTILPRLAAGNSTGYLIQDMVVDSNNKIHFVYKDYLNSKAYYRTNKSGSWVSTELTRSGYTNLTPTSIRIDSSDNLYVSITSNTGDFITFYDGTSWIDGVVFQTIGNLKEFDINPNSNDLLVVSEESGKYDAYYHTSSLSDYVETITADSAPPVVQSIAPAGGPTATNTSVTFLVTFDENANGIDTSDFQLTTTGSAAGNIASVSASSGTTVNVVVNTISGKGTLRVDLKASTNITDDTGNGNNTNGYVAAFNASGATHTVDLVAPVITDVSIPNSAHKVGDTVTATITVSSDSDDYTTGSGGITGTINGYALGSLARVNDTTYTATFTITDGGSDVAAGTNLAVNFTFNDSSGNTSSAFTTAISQGSDAIYANFPEINLTTDTNTIAEDGGVATLTATLSGSLNNQWPTGITVNLAYTGTGTSGTDYSKSDNIVIASGNSSNTMLITGIPDTLFDAAANETAIVDISSLSVGNEGTTNQQTITITDAEIAPTVTLSVGSASVAENGGASTITATLSHATYDNTVVNNSYSGTAVGGGTDYNTPSSSITINAGALTVNAVTGITAVDDGSSDGNLSIIIDVASVTGSASENGTQQKTVTIVDDEDGTAPTITAVSIPNSAHKVGDTVTATITVTSDSDDYTTGSGAITGTLNGYTLGSLSKTNDTTYTATFTVTDGGTDVAAGNNVAVSFTLTDSSGNTSAAFTTAINQVSDAIYANLPDVDLTASTNTIAEDGGVSTLTATLSGSLNNQWPSGITVNLAYTGTGTAGTDYSKSDSIVIASGNSSNTATVTGTADTLFDAAAAETAIVDISSLSVGNEGTTNQQTITITDAEIAPTVTLTTGNANVAENGGTSAITATLSHATYANVTVNLAYTGTATSGGTDYNTPSSAITINGGATSANAVTGITSVDDADTEGNESIVIDIASVTGGSATESGTQQKTVTIIDDDNNAPTLTSLPTTYTVTEDVASAINLSAATFSDAEGDSLTVTLAVNSGTIASIDGNGVIGGVTIANSGTSSMTIAGTIADIHTYLNTVSKIEVTTATNSLTDIILTVTPNDGAISGTPATSTLSVTSVNDEPTLTATASNPSFTENGSAASLYTSTAISAVEMGQNITALTVTVTNVDDTSDEVLNFDGSAISLVDGSGTTATNSFSYSVAVVGTTATVTLSGGSVGNGLMQTLVNAISYQNNSEKPTTTNTRIVTLASISDDGGMANGGDDVAATSIASTVTVIAVNDIPVIANLGGDSFTYNEDSGAVIIDQTSALTLTDVDSADFDSGAITVTITSGEDAAEDLLSLSVAGTVSLAANTAGADVSVDNIVIGTLANNIAEGNDLVVNLNANATPVNIQTLLRAITYSNTDSGAPTTGARNVRTTVTDGDGGTSANNDVTIIIAGVNDDADIGGDLTGGTIEDNGTGATGSLTITDVDTYESTFTAQTANTTTYGTFSVNTSGNWIYDLDSTKAAVQALANGATMTDIITIASVDGTQKQITITITGVNGVATITGISTGAATEDDATQITGSLAITDEDTGEAVFVAQTNAAGSYGAFNLVISGSWTYDLDSTKAVVQALPDGSTLTDSFTATSADGTDSQLVTITITGVNGVATITGTSTGAATEDDATQISGSLAITDEDTGEAVFVAQTNAAGSYGTFNIATSGNWTYDLDSTKAAVQALPTGSTLTDSFTATSADSSDSQLVTITITGVNGVATITGTSTGAATEDNNTQITGSLSITDEDTGEAVFVEQANTAGTYGGFTLATNGDWTYDLDNSNGTVQALIDGGTLTDSFTAVSADGTDSQLVTVTITGVNGVATITGTSTGAATEDNETQITGSLSIADEDTGEAVFAVQANTAGTYGDFTLATNGNWTYDLDNTNGTVQALIDGGTLTDSFTAVSADGTDSQLVTVTITGVNGVATITGTSTGAATEDDATQITGSLAITDEDTGEAVFVAQTNAAGSYGFFSLTLTGTWSYQLDSSNLDVQILPEGETLTDSFTVSSVDGSDSQVVTITVTGINDVATITGTSIADTNEDNTAQVTGSLSITDKDTGEAIFMMQSGVAGTYGTFNIDNQGNWTFTLDNDNTEVQQMSSGEQLTDSFTVMSIDGTDSQVITVKVFGVNDAPNAEHDELTVAVDNVYVLDVLANDSDVDGDTLSIVGANTSLGTVSTNGESLTLTTQAGFVGQVVLTYTITDGNNVFSETTVDVDITGALSETAPVVTVPETVEVNAEGLFTKVDLGIATALNSQGQPVPISLVDGKPLFRPGNSIAYWQAIDPKTGLTTVASQKVIVHPIISLGKDQVVVEGEKVSVDIILNGEAPAYPVAITLSISGSVDDNDYDIETQEVTIESGTQTSVLIDIVQDNVIEGNETLIVNLGEGNISDRASQVITIVESNIAPKVTLSSSQNAEERQLVTPTDGLVSINAIVIDANDDNVSTQWLYDPALNISEIDDFTLTLDPSGLDSGIYSIGITVIDDGEGNLSTTQTLYFEVLASLAVLTDIDSDGDLIPDNEEGHGDSDQDGIPDFLDAIAECNVMPEQAAVQDGFLVEGEPGVCLRKGNTLAAGETGGLQLTDNDLDNSVGADEGALIVGGAFDFIATGLPQAGQSYQIVLPQIQPIPTGAVYRKYSGTNGWGTFVEDADNQLHSAAGEQGICPPPASVQWSPGLTEGHWCVQLTIEDGGPNDDDGLANGTIVDPGGVSVLLAGNTMPVAQADVVTLKWNDSILIDALANDSDVDGDALSIGVATATFGSVTITADNQLDYQSKADFIGQDTIVYSLSDGKGGTSSGTVSITVYAYENVTVNNQSKGGSMGLIIISLIGVTLYRIRRKKSIGKKNIIHGTAAFAVLTSMSLAAAEPQWFMTGSVGKSHANSHVNIPSDIGIIDSELDKSSTSYTIGGGIDYGVYSFTVSYEQLGDSSASYDGNVIDTALFHQILANVAPKLVEGISLQGQYTLWQGDALSASIGAGLFAWDLDYTSRLNDSVIKVDEDDVDFIYNLQVAYAITEQVQVSLKASRYSLSVNDINNIALGLTYHF